MLNLLNDKHFICLYYQLHFFSFDSHLFKKKKFKNMYKFLKSEIIFCSHWKEFSITEE